MSRGNKTKIFCVGFQKTGTSSMRDALQSIGYRVADYYGTELTYEELKERYIEMGMEIARHHDAVQDMPWPLFYRELDAAFPGSKFILTERDAESWIVSMVKHFQTKRSPVRQLTYGPEFPYPEGHEQHYIDVYQRHNAEVRQYFADRPNDFLVMNLEKGDGWKELGAFLGLKRIPTGDFIHANKAEMRDGLPYRTKTFFLRVVKRLKRMVQ